MGFSEIAEIRRGKCENWILLMQKLLVLKVKMQTLDGFCSLELKIE